MERSCPVHGALVTRHPHGPHPSAITRGLGVQHTFLGRQRHSDPRRPRAGDGWLLPSPLNARGRVSRGPCGAESPMRAHEGTVPPLRARLTPLGTRRTEHLGSDSRPGCRGSPHSAGCWAARPPSTGDGGTPAPQTVTVKTVSRHGQTSSEGQNDAQWRTSLKRQGLCDLRAGRALSGRGTRQAGRVLGAVTVETNRGSYF